MAHPRPRRPARGILGVWNRSHYEDVVTARCIGVIDDRQTPHAATATSASSSACSTDEGTTMVKVFLHISKDEQRARLQARIDDPEKNWKFHRSDLEARERWDEYQERYEEAITRDVDERGRRGTSCPPTTSGCATSRWRACSSRCWHRLDPQIPDPEPGLEGLVVE